MSEEEDEAEGLVRVNPERELKSNGTQFKVVRTVQRTVLVKQTKTAAPDVRDSEEVAKTRVTIRSHSKRVTKKPEALVYSTEINGKSIDSTEDEPVSD